MPRTNWTAAPPNIKAEILLTLANDGPYSAVMRAVGNGYDVPDVAPWTPIHVEVERHRAAGDVAMSNLLMNADPAAWLQEKLARELSSARRGWAQTTSLEDDRARARAETEKQAAEQREKLIFKRAAEMRDEQEQREQVARLERARLEIEQQHKVAPANGTTATAKRART